IRAIEASSPTDVWVVGVSRHLPLVEHWDGQRWSVVRSPRIGAKSWGSLADVAPVAPGDVWVGGFVGEPSPRGPSRVRALLAHWDGSSWTVVPLANFAEPISDFDVGVESLLAISTDDVWAIVNASPRWDVARPERLYAEHWNGSAWTAVSFPFSL